MKDPMKDKLRRKMAAALIVASMTQSALLPAMGAEPKVSVDETIYVNLDYYGEQTAVNVVKGVTTNGVVSYTDHGDYTKVLNMSNHVQPVQTEGTLEWDLSQMGNRFYYQGTLDPAQVEIPWTFDLTYKLNGKEVMAQELAGASGLVEIRVEAEPNEKAALYYRDNMILSVMIPVDMEKCYSVDAPGSQTQTMGETTGVVFTALPGEKGDFTARIGTESYESIGVVIMMIPGTTSSLEHVKEIKETKDTWRQAGSDLYDSMDAMMASVESMRDGIHTVQDSLQSLESARQTISGSRAQIEGQNDISIQALSDLAQQSAAMVPYLQTAKASAEDIHRDMDALMRTVGSLEVPLQDIDEHLDTIQNGMGRTEDVIPALEEALIQVITLDTQLQAQQAAVLMAIMGLSETSMEGDIDEDAEYFADEEAYAAAEAGLEGLIASGKIPSLDSIDPNDPEWEKKQEELTKIHEQTKQEIYEKAYQQYYNGYKNQALGQLATAVGGIESPRDDLLSKVNALETLATHSNAMSRSAQTMLRGMDKATDDIRDILVYSDDLLRETVDLHDTISLYYPILQDGLTDSVELVNRTNNLLNQTVASMTIIQNTLKASSGALDEGTKDALAGSMELLDKGLDMLDSTGEIRKSSGVMKTTLDEQLDKFEDENRFLEMDPEAEMLSFTSPKNAEPHSLQIILRTEEISLDDDDDMLVDMETTAPPSNPFARMWRVLVNMWKAVVDVFKNR